MSNATHSVDTVKDKAREAVAWAGDGVEVAQRSTWQALTSGATMLAKGVSAATVLVAMLRKLDRNDGLAWFGLARRRSPLATMAIFGAGTAMGAGAALLLAPMSGQELRRKLRELVTREKATQTTSTEAEEHGTKAADASSVAVATPSVAASKAPSASAAASVPPNGGSAKP